MKLTEIREIATRFDIAPGSMKKADLIRSIQHSEGNKACFGTKEMRECGQDGCLWRPDCD
jgi:hypothetical protein